MRQLQEHFRAGWRAIPVRNRRHWAITLVVGAAAIVLLLVAIIQAGKRQVGNGPFDWEPAFLGRLEQSLPMGFSSAVFFQTFGTDITLAVLIGLVGGISIWNRRPMTALSLVLCYVSMDLLVRFGWAIWARPRPSIIGQGIAAPGFHSFPSGHTAKTLAVYGLLIFLWIRASRSWIERVFAGLLLIGIAGVVPLGRLRMGAHWPTDIMAGYVLGACWLILVCYALRYERTVPV